MNHNIAIDVSSLSRKKSVIILPWTSAVCREKKNSHGIAIDVSNLSRTKKSIVILPWMPAICRKKSLIILPLTSAVCHKNIQSKYSRISMARTLMARLPRLFRTRSGVPWKKSGSWRFGIVWGDFLCCIENGIFCVLVRIASMRRI